MREKIKYFIVTFHTYSDAMLLEKFTKANGLNIKLIPAPRSLSPGCGIALRANEEDRDLILKIIEDEDVEVDETTILEL